MPPVFKKPGNPGVSKVQQDIRILVENVRKNIETAGTRRQAKIDASSSPEKRARFEPCPVSAIVEPKRPKQTPADNPYAREIFMSKTNVRDIAKRAVESKTGLDPATKNAKISSFRVKLYHAYANDPKSRIRKPLHRLEFESAYYEYRFFLALNKPLDSEEEYQDYREQLKGAGVEECWVEMRQQNLLLKYEDGILVQLQTKFPDCWSGKLEKLDTYMMNAQQHHEKRENAMATKPTQPINHTSHASKDDKLLDDILHRSNACRYGTESQIRRLFPDIKKSLKHGFMVLFDELEFNDDELNKQYKLGPYKVTELFDKSVSDSGHSQDSDSSEIAHMRSEMAMTQPSEVLPIGGSFFTSTQEVIRILEPAELPPVETIQPVNVPSIESISEDNQPALNASVVQFTDTAPDRSEEIAPPVEEPTASASVIEVADTLPGRPEIIVPLSQTTAEMNQHEPIASVVEKDIVPRFGRCFLELAPMQVITQPDAPNSLPGSPAPSTEPVGEQPSEPNEEVVSSGEATLITPAQQEVINIPDSPPGSPSKVADQSIRKEGDIFYSLDYLKKFTNVEELVMQSIMQRLPHESQKRLAKLDQYVARYYDRYRTELAQDRFPAGLRLLSRKERNERRATAAPSTQTEQTVPASSAPEPDITTVHKEQTAPSLHKQMVSKSQNTAKPTSKPHVDTPIVRYISPRARVIQYEEEDPPDTMPNSENFQPTDCSTQIQFNCPVLVRQATPFQSPIQASVAPSPPQQQSRHERLSVDSHSVSRASTPAGTVFESESANVTVLSGKSPVKVIKSETVDTSGYEHYVEHVPVVNQTIQIDDSPQHISQIDANELIERHAQMDDEGRVRGLPAALRCMAVDLFQARDVTLSQGNSTGSSSGAALSAVGSTLLSQEVPISSTTVGFHKPTASSES